MISSSACSGTTYFISPTGNDNSPGTSPLTPWRSAARASSVTFGSGDAVLFEGGVDHDLVEGGAGLTVRTATGTANPSVVVASYGGRIARLLGDGSRFDGITILNTGGVEVCNVSLFNRAIPHHISFSGIHALSTGTVDDASKYTSVWFHDVETTGFLYGIAIDSFSSCQGFAGARIERAQTTNATGTGISSQGSYSASCYAHKDIFISNSSANWNQVRDRMGVVTSFCENSNSSVCFCSTKLEITFPRFLFLSPMASGRCT